MSTINEQTGISIGVLLTIVGFFVLLLGSAITFIVMQVRILNSLKEIKSSTRKAWTISAQRFWVKQLEQQNPNLDVPQPDETLDMLYANRPPSTTK